MITNENKGDKHRKLILFDVIFVNKNSSSSKSIVDTNHSENSTRINTPNRKSQDVDNISNHIYTVDSITTNDQFKFSKGRKEKENIILLEIMKYLEIKDIFKFKFVCKMTNFEIDDKFLKKCIKKNGTEKEMSGDSQHKLRYMLWSKFMKINE